MNHPKIHHFKGARGVIGCGRGTGPWPSARSHCAPLRWPRSPPPPGSSPSWPWTPHGARRLTGLPRGAPALRGPSTPQGGRHVRPSTPPRTGIFGVFPLLPAVNGTAANVCGRGFSRLLGRRLGEGRGHAAVPGPPSGGCAACFQNGIPTSSAGGLWAARTVTPPPPPPLPPCPDTCPRPPFAVSHRGASRPTVTARNCDKPRSCSRHPVPHMVPGGTVRAAGKVPGGSPHGQGLLPRVPCFPAFRTRSRRSPGTVSVPGCCVQPG